MSDMTRTVPGGKYANRINNKGYLYHGKLLGNINFSNKATPGTTGALVMDG